jgi:toxin ParE1/3/4
VIRFRPAAAREFVADYRWYEKRYQGRGDRFVSAVERVLERIAVAPNGFPLLLPPDIRSAKVPRFPYRIVFVLVGTIVDVIAIAHAKRRPAYWRRRR